MADQATQRLLEEVSQLRRIISNMTMYGTVKEVKGDKLRAVIGKNGDGKEILSPWIHQNNHRGGSRERRFFKGPKQQDQNGQGQSEAGGGGGGGGGNGQGGGGQGGQEGGGQNVVLFCPSGDPRQAIVMAYAPNKEHPAPDHANKSGQDEETYQLEDLRVSKAKDGYDIWLEEPKKQDQQQGGAGGAGGGAGGGQEDSKERNTGGEKARMKFRLHNDGGFTGRIGHGDDAVRVHVHKDGGYLRTGKNIALVDKKEKRVKVKSENPPITDKPWQVKDWEPSIQVDDK